MSREIQFADTWGKRLRQARVAADLSQMELGIKAGIDPSVASTRINRYEVGKHKPDPTVAVALGKVLKVSAAYFYAPEDDLAELIFRLGRASASERKEVFRSLSHIEGPPPPDSVLIRRPRRVVSRPK